MGGTGKNAPLSRFFTQTFSILLCNLLGSRKRDLIIRDSERNTVDNHTTRIANFDAARYLCQWARLARVIGGSLCSATQPLKNCWTICDLRQVAQKRAWLILFRDENIGLQYQSSNQPHYFNYL